MPSNKVFQVAIFISVLIHSALFLGVSHAPFFSAKISSQQPQTIYYRQIENPHREKLVGMKPFPERKKLVGEKPMQVAAELPEVKKEEILKPPKLIEKKADISSNQLSAAKDIKEKKFETIIEEETDDVKKAAYITYYHSVREKIKQCAEKNYSRNRSMGNGEVYLSFVLASSGELLQVAIIDKMSTAFQPLKSIAMDSIRDAIPFPPFPSDMGQYQITFNVTMSFEPQ